MQQDARELLRLGDLGAGPFGSRSHEIDVGPWPYMFDMFGVAHPFHGDPYVSRTKGEYLELPAVHNVHARTGTAIVLGGLCPPFLLRGVSAADMVP